MDAATRKTRFMTSSSSIGNLSERQRRRVRRRLSWCTAVVRPAAAAVRLPV
jgi:hypothetical protein